MYTGLESKAVQGRKVTEALDQVIVEWWLTRFACWAFTITAPFGHCTGDHLDL